MKTRILSGIVLVIIMASALVCGSWYLFGLNLMIALIGMFELYRIFHIERTIAGIAGFLAAVLFYCNLKFAFIPDTMMFVIGFLVVLMFIYVFSYPKYHTEQMLAAFFGVFYVAVMLSYIYQTRMLPQGAYTVWLIFLCSWGCDTCAYCVGMLIGKHKMAPVLSPKKSVEGAIGGVVGAVLLGVAYAAATGGELAAYGIICGVGALISMVGDLAASAIKRNQEIKDYGKLIPGHGGILDRFDSVIFTAPIIYFLSTILM